MSQENTANQAPASLSGRHHGRRGSTSVARQTRSAVKILRICSAPLRPKRVTADRAGLRSLRRAAPAPGDR